MSAEPEAEPEPEAAEIPQESDSTPEERQEVTINVEEVKEEDPSPPLSERPVVPMTSFFTVDNKTRQFIHSKLRAYESRRRSTYAAKLESSSLYWRSFRDLLSTSIHETGRAERLVLGTARANAFYSDALQASYDDTLVDDRGALVLDPKKRSKLLLVRSQQDYALAPVVAPRDGAGRTRNSALTEERRTNMLSSLIDSQQIVADKFGENSKQLESEIASELKMLRVGLENKIVPIREIGDAIISELEATEIEVTQAWDSYYSVATKTLSGEGRPPNLSLRNLSFRRAGVDDEETDMIEECADVWIVEMRYRVAVAYQSFAWESGSDELSKLFASMKEEECNRRMNTREYLVAFIQRQERLFMSLPDIHTPVLKALVGRDMDRSTLEEVVQNDIRKRAERLAREEAMQKSAKPVSQSLLGADVNEGNFVLPSPMQSELMSRAKVVERKVMISTWKLCLAIVTVDNFLHLFDLPSGKLSLGSAPEAAFQVLVPKVELPSADFTKGKKVSIPAMSVIKGWCDGLTPSESLLLPNCTISQPKYGRDASSFDIQEAIFNTGASKMFSKTATKKITLRTFNKKESQDWIMALKRN